MEESCNDKDRKDSCSNEDFVNFTSEPPTLQSIASVAIVTKLWSKPEIIQEFRSKCEYIKDPECDTFHELEEKIMNKIKGSLPNLLQSIVCSFVRPIGVQLIKWSTNISLSIIFKCNLHQTGGALYWTMEGTIDEKKSLEEFIKAENPEKDYSTLYKLACRYCLEEYIFDLWHKMPSKEKNFFEFLYNHNYSHFRDYWLAYWTFTIKNEWHIMLKMKGTYKLHLQDDQDDDDDFNILKNMILVSIHICNRIAFKCFWQKFVEEEKNTNNYVWLDELATKTALELSRFTIDIDFYEYIMKFLLSHVKDQSHQKEIARNNSVPFLKSLFSSWPRRRFFQPSPLLYLHLSNISVNDYLSVMNEITGNIARDRSGELFTELWNITPLNLKQMLFKRNSKDKYAPCLLLSLIKTGYSNTAFDVLNHVSVDDKEPLLSIIIKSSELTEFISPKNDLALLDVLFMELLPPGNNLDTIKQECINKNYEIFRCKCCEWLCHGDVVSVNKFLKWMFPSERERENYKMSLPPKDTYIRLLSLGNYDHVRQFANWYFSKENEAQEMKNILFDEKNLKSLLEQMGYRGKSSVQLFDRFAKYYMASFDEIPKFKELCLKQIKFVLRNNNFKFASTILKWCFGNKKEVYHFKTELILSECGLWKISPPYNSYMLDKVIRAFETSDLLKWVLPLSREIITELKISLSCDENFQDKNINSVHFKRQILFRLLDCQNLGEVNAISRDYWY